MAKGKAEVHVGSGNVFRDLGLKNPEERLAKAKLAARIVLDLEKRGLSQAAAAEILGIDQPKVSLIYRGRLEAFSIDRLMRLLNALNHDVRIVVEHTPRRHGKMIVEA